MTSFGEKLRQERESRRAKLDDIAGTTKIRVRFLEALEQDEFEELPGPAFGKFFIRAYAEALDMDPEPLIADYDREQKRRAQAAMAESADAPHGDARARIRDRLRRWAGAGTGHESTSESTVPSATEIEPAVADEEPEPIRDVEPVEIRSEQPVDRAPEPVNVPEASVLGEAFVDKSPVVYTEGETDLAVRPGPLGLSFRPVIVAAVALALVAVVVIAFLPFGDSEGEAGDGLTAMPAVGAPSESVSDPEIGPSDAEGADESTTPPPVETAAPADPDPIPTPAPGSLSVSEFGIGRDVVNRRLQGKADRFEEGVTVSFWTRVMGGRRGQSIRHVWLRDGRPVQSVKLEIGGPHWRTHSRKTLWGTGSWAVEARDADGGVLARSTFTCVSAGS